MSASRTRSADGALELVAGKLVGARRDGDGFAATIRRRGATATETLQRRPHL